MKSGNCCPKLWLKPKQSKPNRREYNSENTRKLNQKNVCKRKSVQALQLYFSFIIGTYLRFGKAIDTIIGLKWFPAIVLVVSDFARYSHLFLYSHTTRPFDAVLFDMEISKSKNTLITTSILISDRPKSTALNLGHIGKWKRLWVRKSSSQITKTALVANVYG